MSKELHIEREKRGNEGGMQGRQARMRERERERRREEAKGRREKAAGRLAERGRDGRTEGGREGGGGWL